jgi:tetratricopeptide (TPR) repeat protein
MATPRLPLPPGPVPVTDPTHGSDTVIPRELAGAAGATLAALLECVGSWVQRPVESRGLGYHPAAERVDPDGAPELLLTCEALLRLVMEEQPDSDTAEAVGLGCFQIAEWCEERGALATALAWAQAAIATWPQQPHYAYLIGRLARKRAQYAHAEEWLRYAMRLSRRRMVWEVYALALSGYANLKRQKGNMPAAVRFHRLALKAARRHGLRSLEGDALYDLAVMAIDMDDIRSAIKFGRQALHAYGPGHMRVPRLAHDFAFVLMHSYGEFTAAASIMQSLLPHIWEPPFRVLLLANLCRACAGADWDSIFERTWVEAWTLLRQSTDQNGHARALIQLAYAAGRAGSWERARLATESAAIIARERREGEVLIETEEMLVALRAGESDPQRLIRIAPDCRWISSEPQPALGTEDLVGDIVETLRNRRDEAPVSPILSSI